MYFPGHERWMPFAMLITRAFRIFLPFAVGILFHQLEYTNELHSIIYHYQRANTEDSPHEFKLPISAITGKVVYNNNRKTAITASTEPTVRFPVSVSPWICSFLETSPVESLQLLFNLKWKTSTEYTWVSYEVVSCLWY